MVLEVFSELNDSVNLNKMAYMVKKEKVWVLCKFSFHVLQTGLAKRMKFLFGRKYCQAKGKVRCVIFL